MSSRIPELANVYVVSTVDARKMFWLDSNHLRRLTPEVQGQSAFGVGRGTTYYKVSDLERLAISVHGKDNFEAKVQKRQRRKERAKEMKEAVDRAAEKAREDLLAKRKLAIREKENELSKARRVRGGETARTALGASASANVSSANTMTSSSSSSAAHPLSSGSSSSSSASLAAAKVAAQQEAAGYELKPKLRADLVKALRSQLRRMIRNGLSLSPSSIPQAILVEATCVLPEVFASLLGRPEDPTLRTFSQIGQTISLEATCETVLGCSGNDVRRSAGGSWLVIDTTEGGIMLEYLPSKFLLRIKTHTGHGDIDERYLTTPIGRWK
ncbi:Hypothetical Protein FCC1311_024742 [Hondaea fermentalgiana]|uniref:Uncharacterized protein n=1 Tax=Hondaea fermentalgiana TaxID=2315210 RepID=A0A2R5GCD6_9STRA|nr:Hypothetical Protein FCC1311_024742 [Hondaea fermentalgiana]|eukprot:GBG26253.1 Hypothetical Protein FCC1311_024742 [Hondaea fermentalgiana]